MATRQMDNGDSPSRKAVKAMLAQKMTVREIAEVLNISPQAVRKHLAKIAKAAAGEKVA